MLTVEILQHLPVSAPFLDECDDCAGNADPDQALVGIGRVNERRLASALRFGQFDVLMYRNGVGGVLEPAELFLEADFGKCEVRRRQWCFQ